MDSFDAFNIALEAVFTVFLFNLTLWRILRRIFGQFFNTVELPPRGPERLHTPLSGRTRSPSPSCRGDESPALGELLQDAAGGAGGGNAAGSHGGQRAAAADKRPAAPESAWMKWDDDYATRANQDCQRQLESTAVRELIKYFGKRKVRFQNIFPLVIYFTQSLLHLSSAGGSAAVCIGRFPAVCQRPRAVPSPSQRQSAPQSRRGRTGAAPATSWLQPLVGELTRCGRRLPAIGAGLAGDARGLPAAQPADDAGRRRCLFTPSPVCRRFGLRRRRRRRSRRLHKTGYGESAEGRFGDKPEAGLGTDKILVANENWAMIKVDKQLQGASGGHGPGLS